MKHRKHIVPLLLSLLAACVLLCTTAAAAGSIQLDRPVSLTLSCQPGGQPLAGARFDLYLLATADETGELNAVEPFTDYNVNIRGRDDDAWRALATTLEGYILRDKLAPTDTARTDENGTAVFPSGGQPLTPGLYLVLGHRLQDGSLYFDPLPFVVMLPAMDLDANAWVYDVTAVPKYDLTPVPDVPETTVIRVLKVWQDTGHEAERPREVTVQLLMDGQVKDTVTLNAANNWRWFWDNLDPRFQWTVVEQEVPGYTVTVTQEGSTFVVTNTCREETPPETPPGETPPEQPPEKPETPSAPEASTPKPGLPQTGQLWWPVPLLMALGLLFVAVGLVRRRQTDRGAGNE